MINFSTFRGILTLFQRNKLSFSTHHFLKSNSKNTHLIKTEISMPGWALGDVVSELNKFADLKLAESWDNVGLLVEPITPTKVNNILLTNDLTESIMQEALTCKANLIISYHPPIFVPLKKITNATWKERIIATCLENRIAVFSPHTSWDATVGGVTDWLIQAFSGEFDDSKRKCIVPSKPLSEHHVYVDVLGEHSLLQPLVYSDGKRPVYESVLMDGRQMFKICCERKEVQKFLNLEGIEVIINTTEGTEDPYTGMGRVIFVNNLTLTACVQRLKVHLGLKYLRLAVGVGKNKDSIVNKIAFVPGSGASLLKGVPADLYVTGEMFHHDILEANHNGVSVILTNHSDSERGFLHCMRDNLQKTLPNINVMVSLNDKDPIETV